MSHAWTRYWTTPDGGISLADQGFLVGPSEEGWFTGVSGDLWTFDAIADLRCLILLGEPGLGKSETLHYEAGALGRSTRHAGDLVVSVDLASTREESVLRQEIFGSDIFQAWVDGDQELHLFLDSLDEAVLRIGIVGDVISKGLRNCDASRLRLRLACRTADRVPGFEDDLRSLWSDDESGVYELAPLRRQDAQIAATNHGLEPQSFVEDLIERSIVPLAIKPITLNMLLDLAQDPDGLPTSQIDLYDRGLLKLVSEPGERRHRDPSTRGQLSPRSRVAVARRIAGATIITGRTIIGLGNLDQGTVDRVTLAQLDGGQERDDAAAIPSTFDVTESGLREVLGTGLFSARGDGLGWAHQTYGEHLAARYLTGSQMTVRSIVNLLVGESGDGRVVPQLRDVAGLAATMRSDLFDGLAARDALVLLRGDLRIVDGAMKAKLVEALLHEEVAQELDQWDIRNRSNLRELGHVSLAATLRDQIHNRSATPAVRELACALAELCATQSLQDDLLNIALDANEPTPLRVAAVKALQNVAGDDQRRSLLPLASDPLPEDSDDELKGAALRAVCPSVISAAEALVHLTPQKNPSLRGGYSMFLQRDLPADLTDDELPAALEWLTRLPERHDPMGGFSILSEVILNRAVEAEGRADVESALVELVIDALQNRHDLQTYRTLGQAGAFTDQGNRHRLVKALIAPMRDERLDPTWVVIANPSLVTDEDLPWLIEHLHAARGGPDERAWAELVAGTAGYINANHDLVMHARETSPLLYELTRNRYGPIELDCELAVRLRTNYREEREWVESERRLRRTAAELDSDLEALLDRFESGDLTAFWQLNVVIWGENGARNLNRGGSDLTASPGWERATPARRARIAAAARVYLEKYPTSADWLDPRRRCDAADAGYRAVRFLHDAGAGALGALDDDTLCRWVPAVLTFTHNPGDAGEQEFTDSILREIGARCAQQLIDATTRQLLAEAAQGDGYLFVLYRVRPILDGLLGQALLQLWKRENLRAQPQAELLAALLRAGIVGAVEAGLEVTTAELVATEPERARLLASTLIAHMGASGFVSLRPLLDASPVWASKVFESVATDWDRLADLRTELPEDQLAELFIWLSHRFPRGEDPSDDGVHDVGPREQVAQYRDQILAILIDRGSRAAVDGLDRIEAATGRELPYVRVRMEENRRLKSWIPPRPEDVVRLAADARSRVVRSSGELQHVLLEALERVQDKLGQGQAHQVWDTTAHRPKGETEVAAWIADRLREDLDGRGIVINREVEVRVNPGGGIGQRTDIHVDAIAGERVEGAAQVTVVIEVKGCWHPELLTAIATQLADRYLSPAQPYAIYLVVRFSESGWSEPDDNRRRVCARRDWDQVESVLENQARQLGADGYRIRPRILDASMY